MIQSLAAFKYWYQWRPPSVVTSMTALLTITTDDGPSGITLLTK